MQETHFTKEDRKTLTLLESHVFDLKNNFAMVSMNFVEKIQVDAIEKRLSSLEDDKKWLIRIIVGTIIMAVLSFIIYTKK